MLMTPPLAKETATVLEYQTKKLRVKISLLSFLKGVFQFGKTKGVPFVKNVASGWYLAIGDNGRVYMTVRHESSMQY